MLDKETYEREIAICQELSKNGNCQWGNCDQCGVVPLLIKLKTGEVLENKAGIENMKKELDII